MNNGKKLWAGGGNKSSSCYGKLISASHGLDLLQGDSKVVMERLYEIIPYYKKTVPSEILKELFPSFLEGLEKRCQDLLS